MEQDDENPTSEMNQSANQDTAASETQSANSPVVCEQTAESQPAGTLQITRSLHAHTNTHTHTDKTNNPLSLSLSARCPSVSASRLPGVTLCRYTSMLPLRPRLDTRRPCREAPPTSVRGRSVSLRKQHPLHLSTVASWVFVRHHSYIRSIHADFCIHSSIHPSLPLSYFVSFLFYLRLRTTRRDEADQIKHVGF